MNDKYEILAQNCLALAIDHCEAVGLPLKVKRQRMVIKGAIRQMLEEEQVVEKAEEAAAHRQRANFLARRVQAMECLLEDLTPGGSEFAGDPEACAAWVRERLSSVGKLALERNRYRDALRHYADPKNWDDDGMCISKLFPSGVEYMGAREYIAEPDIGSIARAALEDLKESTE